MSTWGVPTPQITRFVGPVIDDRLEKLIANQYRAAEALESAKDELRAHTQGNQVEVLLILRGLQEQEASDQTALVAAMAALNATLLQEIDRTQVRIIEIQREQHNDLQRRFVWMEDHLWELFCYSLWQWIKVCADRSWTATSKLWRRP